MKWKSKIDDKIIYIEGPEGFNMSVDYDDVDHDEVRATTNKIVDLLNKHLPQGN